MFANIRYILAWVNLQPEIKRESRKHKNILCKGGNIRQFNFPFDPLVGLVVVVFSTEYEILEIFNSLLVIRACNHPLEDNFHIFPESISENMEIY